MRPVIRQRAQMLAVSIVCSLATLWCAPDALANFHTSTVAPFQEMFPKPRIVREQIRFWDQIFRVHPSTTMVIHDIDDIDRMIDIIDFRLMAQQAGRKQVYKRATRVSIGKRYLKRYRRAVKRFAKLGHKARNMGAIEERLYQVYRRSPADLKRLYMGEVNLRYQTGLADDFRMALPRAAGFIPKMQKILKSYGVPENLTSLAFVESMFNIEADSKVGAAGMWQFMPGTARQYVFVNKVVDERRDPIKATHAAGKFLSENYRALGTWPLAITAYNHGRAGMRRAVRTTGTRDIGKIIETYRGKAFGFASRNFYAEFVAADRTWLRHRLGPEFPAAKPVADTATVVLPQAISVKNLLRTTGLSATDLAKYNRCIRDKAFTKYRHKTLPKHFQLKVPRRVARVVEAALYGRQPRKVARR